MNTDEKEMLGIVKRIMAFLKLDEAGKINKFFSREIKKFQNNIRDLKNNLSALKYKYDSEIQKLDDAIEDAKEAIVFAEQNITEENVKTNEACDKFSEVYWKNIVAAEKTLEDLLKQKETITETYNEDIKYTNEQISKYEARILRMQA